VSALIQKSYGKTVSLLLENPDTMEFKLSVSADLANLPVIREFIQKTAGYACNYEQFAYDISLAVDELVTNVIVHGYKGSPGEIEIDVEIKPPELVILLRDDAPPFDPTQVNVPDVHRPLEERQVGGLGIYMARVLTDEMIHRHTSEGGNEIRLLKRCPNYDNSGQ